MKPLIAQTALLPAGEQLGNWVAILFLVVNGVAVLGGLIAFFATRREVQEIDRRVINLEHSQTETLKLVHDIGTRLSAEGSQRAGNLHKRIDELQKELGELTGTVANMDKSLQLLIEKAMT